VEEIQMTDNKTEHRGDMGKVAKDREKAPEAGQKGSQRTQGGHQETQPSQSGEKGKVGG
jgi:general stress protein YciG